MTSLIKNYNCDGGHCLTSHGETRLYPLGGGAHLHLCHACWAHENEYRAHKGRKYRRPEDWPLLDWDTAERVRR